MTGLKTDWRGFLPAGLFLLTVMAALAVRVYAQPAANAVSSCVERTANAGGEITRCVGAFYIPCMKDADNAAAEEQVECLQFEFVLWSNILRAEVSDLKKLLKTPRAKEKFNKAQKSWSSFQRADCRLPYVMFKPEQAQTMGPACTIRHIAARAGSLRRWRLELPVK